MKAIVDQDTCTGCELCAQSCPDVYSMTDEGTAVAIASEVPPNLEDSAREAAEGCPVDAISIQE
jgi:ferredoxin